jgi:alginate O-acetyltransferase complex protein AlgI
MLFSSLVFLCLFLPTVMGGYYLLLLPRRLGFGNGRTWLQLANTWLLLFSLVFYAWGELWLTTVMVVTIVVSWLGGFGVAAARRSAVAAGGSADGAGKVWLAATTAITLGMLVFYKYANFGVENYNYLVEWFGLPDWRSSLFRDVVLPLGISFYTFQALSYTIDVYRGEVPATRSIVDFGCYVTMFPQLVAGPIVRYVDVARELVDRSHDLEGLAAGIERFCVGLAKKVLVANTVAVPADAIFGVPTHALTTPQAWLGIVCYSLQIYYDFSAYSDMALGLGRMMGFRFPENFNYPYVARSNQDFWRRWHISLSTWFRDYVYIPLGGNRSGSFGTYRNLLLVFLLCGLWHGASWNFVVWGLYHGFFLVLERLFLGRWLARLPRFLQHAYLLSVAMVGWVLFRVDSMAQAVDFLTAMAGGGATAASVSHFVDGKILLTIAWGVVFAMPVVPVLTAGWQRTVVSAGSSRAAMLESASAVFRPLLVASLLIASASVLASGSHNPFIYFRF